MPRKPEQHLFLFGPPRSGTTALAHVVNAHRSIGLGSERFKYIMNHKHFDQFNPELFEEEKFFDFSDGHTNRTPERNAGMKRYYADLQSRYANLKYIGDKMPGGFRVAREIHQKFPNTKCIFIIRDIFETACSWQARAEDESDNWPSTRTATVAVKPWNACLSYFLDLQQKYPDDFHMVSYRDFFDGEPTDYAALDELCRFLDVSADSVMQEYFSAARVKYRNKIKTKERKLDEAAMAFIEEHADIAAFHQAIGKGRQEADRRAA